MAHLWQVGDKAVCVDASKRTPNGCNHHNRLVEDKIYHVTAVIRQQKWACGRVDHGIVLREVLSDNPDGSYIADRFRPVLPDKHEGATDAEFLVLMGKVKAKTRQVVKV